MKIKDKLIKCLGGFTLKEYDEKIAIEEDKPSLNKFDTVYSDIKAYYIDNDSLLYDKTQLARRIGERMLDNGLIDFTIKQKRDAIGGRVYEVRAKAYVGRFN